ncbi:MAG: hypothetical protein WDA65_05300 [Christensenellales bacterium]
MNNYSEKKNTVLKKTTVLVLLIVLVAAFAFAANNFVPTLAYNTVSVGFVNEPNSYCLIPAISTPGSNYQAAVAESYDDIVNALEDGVLDTALLPVKYLDAIADGYSVVAMTSCLNLTAVESGYSVYSLTDLGGRTVVVPDTLADTLELRMLSEMLAFTQTAADILFESDADIQRMADDTDFDILMLPPEKCAKVLLKNQNCRSSFSLSGQWSVIFNAPPPAGYCIVARDDCIKDKAPSISKFLTAIEASVRFVTTKRKKASAYIGANGVDADFEFIWKVIPCCKFDFQQGDGMTGHLEQLMILIQ